MSVHTKFVHTKYVVDECAHKSECSHITLVPTYPLRIWDLSCDGPGHGGSPNLVVPVPLVSRRTARRNFAARVAARQEGGHEGRIFAGDRPGLLHRPKKDRGCLGQRRILQGQEESRIAVVPARGIGVYCRCRRLGAIFRLHIHCPLRDCALLQATEYSTSTRYHGSTCSTVSISYVHAGR